MLMDAYQRRARKTAIYPREQMIIYPALGLAGESGEVCEKLRSIFVVMIAPILERI